MIFTYRRVLRCSSPVNPRVPLIQFFFNTVTFDVRIMKYWTFYRKRKTSDLRGVFTCRGARKLCNATFEIMQQLYKIIYQTLHTLRRIQGERVRCPTLYNVS
ncbi:uncharacterized protein LOC143154894 isoform X1 [Ptiloglossa arizonensis]|uniref:uncharacterized protein LOC143154894 isoform X1 n=1 Tax=Ptiloglossa arizonensis TaxID=3350558 RepID=UPI003F9FAD74